MSFFGRAAKAFGTIWLVFIADALLARKSINLGSGGLAAVLILCAVYAMLTDDPRERLRALELENDQLRGMLGLPPAARPTTPPPPPPAAPPPHDDGAAPGGSGPA